MKEALNPKLVRFCYRFRLCLFNSCFFGKVCVLFLCESCLVQLGFSVSRSSNIVQCIYSLGFDGLRRYLALLGLLRFARYGSKGNIVFIGV